MLFLVAFCSHWICVWLSVFFKLLLSLFWSKSTGSSLSFFSLVTDMLLDLKSISLCCSISSQFCWDWLQKFMAENNAVEHTMQPAWEQDEPEMITSSTSDTSLVTESCEGVWCIIWLELPSTEFSLPPSLQDNVTETVLQIKDIFTADGVIPLPGLVSNAGRINWVGSDFRPCWLQSSKSEVPLHLEGNMINQWE